MAFFTYNQLHGQSVNVGGYTFNFPTSAPTANTSLSYNGTSYVWTSISGAGDISNGGNAYGGNITIGTNDAFSLILKSNNTTALTFDTSQNPTFTGQTSTFTKAVSGGIVSLLVANDSNTASSDVNIYARVAGTTARNAYFTAGISGDTNWSWGCAQSASKQFRIINAVNITSSGFFEISTAGVLSMGPNTTDFSVGNASFTLTRATVDNPTSGIIEHTATSGTSGHAQLILRQTHASAGDTKVIFDGPNDWAVGQDVSDGQCFVISENQALGTSNRFRIAAGGAVSYGSTGLTHTITGQTNTFSDSIAGGIVGLAILNSNNANVSSHARVNISSGGASGGDAILGWNVTGVTSWVAGIANATSDRWELCASSSIGTNTLLSVTTGGAFALTGTLAVSSTSQFSNAVTIINTGVQNLLKVQRYTNAGDGTGDTGLVVGNSTGQGVGTFFYTNAAASAAPKTVITHTPRNNADSSNTDAVRISLLKTAGNDGGEVDIQTATTGGTLTSALGISNVQDITVTTGHLAVNTAGKGFKVKEGSNAKMGTATLNGTTAVTVSTTAVTASSRIYVTIQASGGTVGSPYVDTRSAGTSFNLKSTNAADTSTVAWMIVEPA